MSNVFAAIQNRDAGALARMMGPDNHQAQQDNVVNISAERLVDALFKQLKQLFPAAEQTNLKTAQQRPTLSASGSPLSPKVVSVPASRYQQECAMPVPVNHRSGRHQVNSLSGAKTARWCLA